MSVYFQEFAMQVVRKAVAPSCGAYLEALLRHGLALEAFEEPVAPSDAALDSVALSRTRMWPYSVAIRARRRH